MTNGNRQNDIKQPFIDRYIVIHIICGVAGGRAPIFMQLCLLQKCDEFSPRKVTVTIYSELPIVGLR